jgi:hypothetical protein
MQLQEGGLPMTFIFKKAKREGVQLLISLAGGSGSGKTWSAMLLAKGLAQGKRFCVIDTERGRASHYADYFDFDTAELNPPFSPTRYIEAIQAADAAGYPVIVVDQFSSEWVGEGGCLDMQEAEFQRMGGRDSVKLASWIKPKIAHKHMVQKLLQVRAHLVLTFRAEEKIEVIKEDGKIKIVPKQSLAGIGGWVPISEKTLPFEMTASFLLTADAPGIPKPIKLQEQHRAMFDLKKPITEESGKRIAEWASGGAPRKQAAEAPDDVPPVDNTVDNQPPATIEKLPLTEIRHQFDACESEADVKTITKGLKGRVADADRQAAINIREDRIAALRKAIG